MALTEYPGTVSRMCSTLTVRKGIAVNTMLAPQIELMSNGILHVTTMEHDTGEEPPRYKTYPIDLKRFNYSEEALEPSSPQVPDNAVQAIKENADKAKAAREAYAAGLATQQQRLLQVRRQAQAYRKENSLARDDHPPSVMPQTSSSSAQVPLAPAFPFASMFQALGPLSGSASDTKLEPFDAFNVQTRKPPRAEPFRAQDRQHKQQQPVPFFHTPEHRIGTATFALTLNSLI